MLDSGVYALTYDMKAHGIQIFCEITVVNLDAKNYIFVIKALFKADIFV